MSFVTASVEKYVPDPTAALVRAKILGSRWKARDERTEAGAVTLKVTGVLRASLKLGDIFEIEGVRGSDPMGRQIDLRNPWNALPLTMNEELVLALHAGPSARVWVPLAMTQADGDDAGLREAIGIEALPPHHRLARIQNALVSDSYQLRRYCLSALKEPGIATREQAASAIATAFTSATAPATRIMLFDAMESRDYFQPEVGPDAANVVILTAWLQAIVHETDEHQHTRYLDHLAAVLGVPLAEDPAKDRALRARFSDAVHNPSADQVAAALRAAAAAHPGDPRFQNLADSWTRSASAVR
ncbi:MAG TPA: hypothetical protein VGL53_00695 [Bryobacteraceae bacterium]